MNSSVFYLNESNCCVQRARVERILSSAKGTSPMDNSRVAKEVRN